MDTLPPLQIHLLVPAAAPNAPATADPLFDLYAWDPADPQAQHGLVALGQHTADYEPAATLLWLQYANTNNGTTFLSVEGDWPKEAPIVLIWRDDVAPQFCHQAQITWSPRSGSLSIAYPRSARGANAWDEALTQARAFLAPTGGLLIQYDFAHRQPAGEWRAPVLPAALPEEAG